MDFCASVRETDRPANDPLDGAVCFVLFSLFVCALFYLKFRKITITIVYDSLRIKPGIIDVVLNEPKNK